MTTRRVHKWSLHLRYEDKYGQIVDTERGESGSEGVLFHLQGHSIGLHSLFTVRCLASCELGACT